MNMFNESGLPHVLDLINDGMIAIDSTGSVTLFNSAAERIFGISRDAVMGRPAIEVIPNTRLHLVLSSGEAEMNALQDVGAARIMTNRIPLKDGRGNVIAVFAVFRDVTEIRDLTDQVTDLWKVRTLLEAVIEATEDAISVADIHGNTIIVNPAYTRITGLPKEAVLNRPVTVDIAEGESMHLKILRTGKPVRNVRMKVGPAGRDVVVNVAPIFIDGRVSGSVGVIHDMSEIMALTGQLAEAKRLLRQLNARYTWSDIIGRSSAITAAVEQARRAAETPATVLLRGESGTGKELFAHAIHNASSRKKGQFVRVNCAALSEDLLESELFGYEEGAFTGARKGGRKGLFEEAVGGTLFLDEIGEMSLALQRKLLRVLQEKEIVRVGGTKPVAVNARVIAATNVDMEKAVKEGVIRGDLYFRLNVLPIVIPSLRQRKEDLPLLVEHLLFRLNQFYGREVKDVSEAALEVLGRYDWPGNVRELENVLGRAMIAMRPQDRTVEELHLPALDMEQKVHTAPQTAAADIPKLNDAVADAEKTIITRALAACSGNREKAAALLGVSLRTFFYKMKRLGITGQSGGR